MGRQLVSKYFSISNSRVERSETPRAAHTQSAKNEMCYRVREQVCVNLRRFGTLLFLLKNENRTFFGEFVTFWCVFVFFGEFFLLPRVTSFFFILAQTAVQEPFAQIFDINICLCQWLFSCHRLPPQIVSHNLRLPTLFFGHDSRVTNVSDRPSRFIPNQ